MDASTGAEMQAGVPYYGVAPDSVSVARIKAPLLCHLAEHDERVNATYPAFEAALKAAGVPYQVFVYPGTQHGFHNDSTSCRSTSEFTGLRGHRHFMPQLLAETVAGP